MNNIKAKMSFSIDHRKSRNTKKIQIANIIVFGLAFILFIAFSISCIQLFNVAKSTFLIIILIFIITLLICAFILYVACRYSDLSLHIISISLSSLLALVSIFSFIIMCNINGVVNNAIENTGKEQYETLSGYIVSYETEYSDIKDVSNKKIGLLKEEGVGISSLIKEILAENKINYDEVEVESINDLFLDLTNKKIDIAVMPNGYRQLFENDDNYDYSKQLNNMYDFYSFEKRVLVSEKIKNNIDVTVEPFNVLLIGFAQNDEYSKYGLADTIIVATVNPQTLTVTLTSIARDSYVPISCYSGGKDKINAARGTSRACLIDTVSNLLDIDIDFYVEVNFKAVVDIIDALGGVMINSPVTFVGQNSSYKRGEMTVLVPEGEHLAMGEEALAFARERHAMPAGDFDRQKHQQEVIKEMIRKVVQLKDISKALKIMNTCGENISTNLSVQQLTSIFNCILKAPNYLDSDQYELIDIQNMRVTGYSSWHYNAAYGFPLWIYKLYNGSIKEAVNAIDETLGDYSNIEQTNRFYFFAYYPYERGTMYSTEFNEKQEHEVMPLTCPDFTTMSYDAAMSWASANGININVNTINSSDSRFDETLTGKIIEQNTPVGTVLQVGDYVTITVMGKKEEPKIETIPNFVGRMLSEAETWASQNGYTIVKNETITISIEKNGVIFEQNPSGGSRKDNYNTITIKYYKCEQSSTTYSVTLSCNGGGSVTGNATNLSTGQTVTVSAIANEGYHFVSWSDGGAQEHTVTIGTENITLTATFAPDGQIDPPEPPAPVTTTFYVKVSCGEGGTVSGGGTELSAGQTVTVSAIANEGYHFVSWSDGGAETHDVTIVDQNIDLVAVFEANPTEE